MFSQKTIDEINNLDLVAVIEQYVKLTKSGSTYKGKSPFTDEKTGSFHVSPSKGMWKCFSTQIGGNSPVKFVMEHRKLQWKEAINELAGKFNITVEYDNDKGDKYLERYIKIGEIREVNNLAMEWFRTQLLDIKAENSAEFKKLPEEVIQQASRATMDSILEFQIGYAPNDWKALYSHLLSQGCSHDLIIQSGLVTEKTGDDGQKKVFDFFRNRIMFPIYGSNGALVGFTGRAVEWKKGDEFPKVLNSRENDLFKKSEVLLGFSVAKNEIVHNKTAIKVEGNFDVTAFHEKGLKNTVAALGTAFTDSQAKQIKRFADKVILAIDNDEPAKKKVENDVITCLENNLAVDVWFSEVDGEDPFDYCQNFEGSEKEFQEAFKAKCVDGVDFVVKSYFENCEDIRQKTQAQENLVVLLATIPNQTLRNNYIKSYLKPYGIEKGAVESKVSADVAAKKAKELEKTEGSGTKLPAYLNQEQIENFNEYGFYPDYKVDKMGYYFQDGKYPERVSNCVIKPIFQVESMNDSTRIVELHHVRKGAPAVKIMELTNEAFVSQLRLEVALANHACYFHGSKKNYQFLIRKLYTQFPMCTEIKTLGWQPAGFFAFANGVIDSSFKEINNYGICIQGDKNYYLPAYSSIYKELSVDDEDKYENAKKIIYRSSGVKFKDWAKLFNEVYKDYDNGMITISFLLASLFSDHIYSVNNSFPMLFHYGKPKTGKTTIGRSISAIFKSNTIPLSLHQTTHAALPRVLSRVRNIIEHLDEYRNDLDEKIQQILKNIFDRMGREKGQLSSDNQTSTTKINAAVQVSGQHMPTRDQNALFSRIIFLTYTRTEAEYSIDEAKLFKKLSTMEKAGLSDLIVEIVKYRDFIVENFEETQFQISSELKHEFKEEEVDGRVQKNLVICCTMVKLLGDKLDLPFTYDKFLSRAKQIIISQSSIIAETDELVEFFKMIEFLFLNGQITRDKDFKIESVTHLRVRNGRKGAEELKFEEPKKILHLSFSRIYPLYSEWKKRTSGEYGESEVALKGFMKNHKSFMGTPPVVNFNGHQSSAYSFDLDLLPITLEYTALDPQDRVEHGSQRAQHGLTPAIEANGFGSPDNNDDLPF